MLTKEYILDCIERYCTLEGLDEYNFEEFVAHRLRNAGCFDCDWTWDNGVTKGVLIFSGLDFVVKIPFEGSGEYYESHYENRHGDWVDSDYQTEKTDASTCGRRYIPAGDYFEKFSGADCENGWDYCEVEATRYYHAEREGVAEFFAKTEWIGDVNDHPIYIQERCHMFREESTSNQEKYESRTKADYEKVHTLRQKYDFHSINDDWLLDFLIYYGEEMFKKLADFIFNENIYDLHNGNIGYRKGRPCLVDYSSYDC